MGHQELQELAEQTDLRERQEQMELQVLMGHQVYPE